MRMPGDFSSVDKPPSSTEKASQSVQFAEKMDTSMEIPGAFVERSKYPAEMTATPGQVKN